MMLSMKSTNAHRSCPCTLVTIVLGLFPMLAQAHPGHGINGFGSGISHPLGGLDHILAMIAVGLWAVQTGKSARWGLPLAFVGAMIFGGLAGMVYVPRPFVEHGILASVVILGALLASATRLSLGFSLAAAGVFGLFHGYAHGAEISDSAGAWSYHAGFALATVLLHALGIGAALLMERFARFQCLRPVGAAIALAGFLLFIA
jgi:urease accessory protein